jgi:tRNA-specific 2-thiouridylase
MAGNNTIVVAMSGGVDSSTAAAILAHAGETVIGLTLQLWDQTRIAGRHGIPDAATTTSGAGRCCSLDDVYDARRVAEHLGIPYYVVNEEEHFEREVVRPFVAEYLKGRTPMQQLSEVRPAFEDRARHRGRADRDRPLRSQRVRRCTRQVGPEAAGGS